MNKKLIEQIIMSYGARAALIVISFLTVPITINLLGKGVYGEWVIILSVMGWVAVSDFGINSGLRNFITNNFGNKLQLIGGINYAFSFIFYICITLLLILLPIFYILPEHSIKLSLAICLFLVFCNFPFSISTSVLHGVKKTPVVLLAQLIGALFIYCVVVISDYSNLIFSLETMSIVYGISLFVISIFSWLFIIKKLNFSLPNITKVKRSEFNNILNTSSHFFIISISILVIMNTDYVIVLYLFSPDLVTEYFAYEKIYSVYNTLFSLLLIPMWSFISQALLDKDIYWIKGLIHKILLVYFSSLIFLLFLYFCSSALITIWLGFALESFHIPAVNVSFALGAGVLAWNGIFSTVLNGLGQTKVQMYCYLIAAVINIPISYFLCINMGLGIYGVKLGTVCSLLITSIFLPIQVYKLLYVKNVFDKN